MMANMPPDAMGSMDAPMMSNMSPDCMDAITPAQMVNMPPDVAGMMPDDGGMGALGGALDPAPVDNVAPMDPVGDALSGAMDQAADQGAGGGAPDMGVPPDAGADSPMDDPNAPDPNAPPDEVDPIV
jgi:hypothetical protein